MSTQSKKFVHFSTNAAFEANREKIFGIEGHLGWADAEHTQPAVYWTSIVFNKEKNEIWNRGTKYGFSAADKEASDASIEDALHYNTSLGELTTPSAIGGIKSGIKASDLNGKTIDEMLTMILFPEINPTIVAPSGTTTFANSSFKNGGLYEVNSTLPTESDLGYTFNRGSITVPGLSAKNRAGAATGATYAVSGGATTFDVTAFAESTYTYKATISYGAGEEALTSYSNKATVDVNGTSISNPLPAGSLTGSAISVKGVYPIYASSTTAGTLTKQTLTSSKSNVALTMVAGASQTFAVKGTVSKILEYNAVSGKYDIDKTTGYNVAEVTLQSGGSDVTGYKKYTRKVASGDSVKIQITFS